MTTDRNPTPVTRQWLVVMNDKSGTNARGKVASEDPKADLRSRLADQGIEVTFLSDLKDLAKTMRGQRFDAVLAGGGDGTVTSVASAVADLVRETSLEQAPSMGVIPLGTFNNFARSIHLPLDFHEALDALAQATPTPHDAGFVTGASASERMFLNVATLGLHPAMVKDRDAQLKKKPQGKLLGKWPAMLSATYRVLARFPRHRLQLKTPEKEMIIRTPGVYVCRDCAKLHAFGIPPEETDRKPAGGTQGERTFSILIGKTQTRLGALWIALRAAVGKLPGADDFEMINAGTCEIDTRHHHHLDLALDGEAVQLKTPINFELRRNVIRVLMPKLPPESDS